MFVIRCLLVSTLYVFFKRGGCSGMRCVRFEISAAFLAWGGLAINLCCTHDICGVSWCRGCRVEGVPGFDCTRVLTLTVCAVTIQLFLIHICKADTLCWQQSGFLYNLGIFYWGNHRSSNSEHRHNWSILFCPYSN